MQGISNILMVNLSKTFTLSSSIEMNELIDRDSCKPLNFNRKGRMSNTVMFGLIAFVVLMTIFVVLKSKSDLDSPFLPEYAIYYLNSGLINFTIIMVAGVIPGLFLRLRKKYQFSTYVMVGFLIAGLFLKDVVPLYRIFI